MTEKKEDDDHRDDDGGIIVHLGFIEPVKNDDSINHHDNHAYDWIGHASPQYDLWDGGQIGGRPTFLDPENLPSKPISCLLCGDVMKFVLQVYAPIDDYEDRAFHRSLYVFCCPNNNSNHHCHDDDKTVGTIRVLRVQLPRENPYFPYESSSSNSSVALADWNAHLPSSYNLQLCHVCGMRAPFKCPLQGCYFCGKQHQKEYKKCVFNVTSTQQCSGNKKKTTVGLGQENEGADNAHTTSLKAATTPAFSTGNPVFISSLPSVYPFAALVIGEEEQDDEDSDPDNNDKKKAHRKTLFDYDSEDDEEELDRNLEQDDLNRMTGRKSTVEVQHDVTAHFQRKCQSNPWQVLRYARTWASTTTTANNNDSSSTKEQQDDNCDHPLWIRADHQPKDIPPCPYCHAPRKFEFQLMPQLLHGLERLQKEQRQQRQQQESSLVHAAAAEASVKSASGADGENDKEKNGQPGSKTPQQQQQESEANKYRQIMDAVQQAEDLIQQAPPEQIPPSLVEAKEAAVERLRQERFGLGGKKNHTSSGGGGVVDWGVVAIYTCTNSCNGGEPADGVTVLDPVLGTYREEFAWRQPSLDAP
jgi:pre-rRNA-processing protein TSR4